MTEENTTEKRQSFEELVKASDVPVLVDVFSDTCGPCIALKPVLKELKQRMGEELRIVKINGPRNMAFMQNYQVRAFPTLILFKDGEIVWLREGWMNAKMLEKMVRTHAA